MYFRFISDHVMYDIEMAPLMLGHLAASDVPFQTSGAEPSRDERRDDKNLAQVQANGYPWLKSRVIKKDGQLQMDLFWKETLDASVECPKVTLGESPESVFFTRGRHHCAFAVWS